MHALQYVLWNRFPRVCVQVYTIRPRPDVSIFVENAKVIFFPFFKNCLSTRRVFVSFLSVQMCPFSFESAKALFPFLIIYPSTRGVFDTVTSSFSKVPFSRVYTRKHENSAITREPIVSEKFHFCIILRYFDQGCLSLVII